MVDWKIGKIRIRNLEIFTFTTLAVIYLLAFYINRPELAWLYDFIANLSHTWAESARNPQNALLMAFIFATFGNTTVLIVFPYALIVWYIALQYPNWWLLGIISGLGAGVGEVTSYLVGMWIGNTKNLKKSELGEKFYRLKLKLERRPAAIPIFIFIAGATPLPDDMLLVPLGILRYPYKRVIIPCMLGKMFMCTLIALLGYLVSFENLAIQNMFPLNYLIPSDAVNPAADLIQFSLIFWVIYLMTRLDIEEISIKRSHERKIFMKMVEAGGEFHFDALVNQFHIHNTENYRLFLEKLSSEHPELKFDGTNLVISAISDKNQSYEISYKFGKWLNS
jgi:membrane protein YqaA with SNARE-associated domain